MILYPLKTAFGPNSISTTVWRLRHIWSLTYLIPGLLVPHFLSPWTNGPHKIDPLDKRSPSNLALMDKWSPTNLVPLDKWSLKYSVLFCLSRGTGIDDLEIWGPNWLGTICPGRPIFWGPFVQGDHLFMGTKFVWDHLSKGINFMGIICPGGQEVEDQMGMGPNALQPNFC